MRTMKLGMMLAVLCAMSAAASAGVIFSDDFTDAATSLPNWSLTSGTLADVTFSEGNVTLQPADQVGIESVQKWTTPGTYQMDYTIMKIHALAYTQRPFVYMPGGISMGFKDWGNGASVYFKGTWIGDVGAGAWNTWLNYSIVLDGRDVQVYHDGVLELNQTMTSDPDFTAYDDISAWMAHGYFWTDGTNYAYDFAAFDNITLSYTPEPATMSLLAAGTLGMLIRQKR